MTGPETAYLSNREYAGERKSKDVDVLGKTYINPGRNHQVSHPEAAL